MSAGRVLIVDDDPEIRSSISAVLGDHGYDVAEAASGAEGLAEVGRIIPDLVLLDLGLPDIGGLDVLVQLTRDGAVPVLVVSARSGETDRVVGLDLGADDYIVKPFSARELVARVNAAIRRGNRTTGGRRLQFGELTIDEGSRDVRVGEQTIALTALEFDVLAYLARSPRQVFSRDQLLRSVWDSSTDWQDDNTVAEHIYRVRHKLDPDDREAWIETVRGVGYRFVGEG
ncbi:MAG: response regulator transcription factor [Ilumatobacteraceae bacterium]